MKNYYGLRLIQGMCVGLSLISAIVSLVAAANAASPYLVAGRNVDIQQIIGFLFFGGLIALTFYIFAQLISIAIHHNTMLQEQSVMMAEINEKFDKLVEILAKKRTKQAVEKDIQQRRQKILKDAQDTAEIKP